MIKQWFKGWEKVRSKGKKRYIIITTLGFTFASIIYSICNYYFGVKNANEFIWVTIIYLLTFSIAGLIVAIVIWELNEKIYTKYLKSKQSN